MAGAFRILEGGGPAPLCCRGADTTAYDADNNVVNQINQLDNKTTCDYGTLSRKTIDALGGFERTARLSLTALGASTEAIFPTIRHVKK
jgi:hypothetical protein